MSSIPPRDAPPLTPSIAAIYDKRLATAAADMSSQAAAIDALCRALQLEKARRAAAEAAALKFAHSDGLLRVLDAVSECKREAAVEAVHSRRKGVWDDDDLDTHRHSPHHQHPHQHPHHRHHHIIPSHHSLGHRIDRRGPPDGHGHRSYPAGVLRDDSLRDEDDAASLAAGASDDDAGRYGRNGALVPSIPLMDPFGGLEASYGADALASMARLRGAVDLRRLERGRRGVHRDHQQDHHHHQHQHDHHRHRQQHARDHRLMQAMMGTMVGSDDDSRRSEDAHGLPTEVFPSPSSYFEVVAPVAEYGEVWPRWKQSTALKGITAADVHATLLSAKEREGEALRSLSAAHDALLRDVDVHLSHVAEIIERGADR